MKAHVKSGIILFMGEFNIPIDYMGNCYSFNQDPNFLYFTGIKDRAELVLVIDVDKNTECLYGNEETINDEIWNGRKSSLSELAAGSGISKVKPLKKLENKLVKALIKNRTVHFLPQHRALALLKIQRLLGFTPDEINDNASVVLIEAVIKQRSIKTEEEVAEIEKALDISSEMYSCLLQNIKPGIYERELLARIESIATAHGSNTSFDTVLTVNGSILHNTDYGNILKKDDLLLVDSGVRSPELYSSDITRTYPASGKFSDRQKEIYNIVLNAQKTAIKAIKPGVKFKDIHLTAVRVITKGLKDLGLMKGDLNDAISKGAHALFFPHGIGHMLGLATHDMEGWGRDYLGYNKKTKRSSQFGLKYLRVGREVEPGFVLTVEPGIYFITALIDLWKSKNNFTEFINYGEVEKYKDFGGIRIEDDILVTNTGHRVLGHFSIPKEIDEIEEEMNRK